MLIKFLCYSGRITLANLTLAKNVSATNGITSTFCGPKIDYFSPDVLAEQSYNSFDYDYWTLGVLLYDIIFEETPFKGSNESETADNIKSKFFEAVPPHSNPEAMQFFNTMCEKTTEARYDTKEILDMLGPRTSHDLKMIANFVLLKAPSISEFPPITHEQENLKETNIGELFDNFGEMIDFQSLAVTFTQ